MKKVALLGAGHIGQSIARLLADSGDYAVTVADQSRTALDKLNPLQLQTRVLVADRDAAIGQGLRGHDLVINALPYHLATTIAQCAKHVGCHDFDLTEDVAALMGRNAGPSALK